MEFRVRFHCKHWQPRSFVDSSTFVALFAVFSFRVAVTTSRIYHRPRTVTKIDGIRWEADQAVSDRMSMSRYTVNWARCFHTSPGFTSDHTRGASQTFLLRNSITIVSAWWNDGWKKLFAININAGRFGFIPTQVSWWTPVYAINLLTKTGTPVRRLQKRKSGGCCTTMFGRVHLLLPLICRFLFSVHSSPLLDKL